MKLSDFDRINLIEAANLRERLHYYTLELLKNGNDTYSLNNSWLIRAPLNVNINMFQA
jgi:hypothetical protein